MDRLRLGLTVTLCLVFLLLMKELVATFKENPVPPEQPSETQKTKPYVAPRPISLYPAVPARLPDMTDGYLFTETRSIEGEAPAGRNVSSHLVDIDDVLYEGSLIVGDTRKAIISYPEKKGGVTRAGRYGAKSRNVGKDLEHVQLIVGEAISGYKVVEILPEKIVFEKSGERIEKKLYDSDKQRQITSSPQKSSPQSVVREPPKTVRQSPTVTPDRSAPDKKERINRRPPPPPPEQQQIPTGRGITNPYTIGR